jgi:hypothetical protein
MIIMTVRVRWNEKISSGLVILFYLSKLVWEFSRYDHQISCDMNSREESNLWTFYAARDWSAFNGFRYFSRFNGFFQIQNNGQFSNFSGQFSKKNVDNSNFFKPLNNQSDSATQNDFIRKHICEMCDDS